MPEKVREPSKALDFVCAVHDIASLNFVHIYYAPVFCILGCLTEAGELLTDVQGLLAKKLKGSSHIYDFRTPRPPLQVVFYFLDYGEIYVDDKRDYTGLQCVCHT